MWHTKSIMAMNELGFYALAGAPKTPKDLIEEVELAEHIGIGNRFNIKEASTLSGAVGAVSKKIGIATAATNHNTRHPIVTGSYASTMHFLTEGRFALGLGRGIDLLFKAMGLPKITTQQLEEFARMMRRLHHGETITEYKSSLGEWPFLRLDPDFDEYIPLILTAFGPNSLALGGRAFDAVVLQGMVLLGCCRRSFVIGIAVKKNRRTNGNLSSSIWRPDGPNKPVEPQVFISV